MRQEDILVAMKNELAPGQPFQFRCDQCGECWPLHPIFDTRDDCSID